MKPLTVVFNPIALLAIMFCISAIIPAVHASRFNDAIEAGDAAFKARDMQMAIDQYQKAVDIDPDSSTAWYRLGLVLEWTGSYEHAISAFDQARAANPLYQADDILNSKGYALIRIGNYQEAVAAFDEAIKLNPNQIDSGVHNNRGLVLLAMGKQKEAMAAFDRAIQLNTFAYETWHNEGVLLAQQGDYNEAHKRFDKIRDRGTYTSSSNIWWDKPEFLLIDQGNVYLLQQDYPQAIETFSLVIREHPNVYDAYIGLGHAYLGAGNVSAAREAALQSEKAWLYVLPEYQNITRTGHLTYYAKLDFNVLTDEMTSSSLYRSIETRALPLADSRLKGTRELLDEVNKLAVPADQQTPMEVRQTTQPTPPPATKAPLPLLIIAGAVGLAGMASWRRAEK